MSTHKPTAEEAANILKDVAEEWQAFWCNHGVIARNLSELSSSLASMTQEQFAHHVNAEKNDFASWVEQVLGDATLATKMRLLTTLEASQRMVARRVEELTAALAPAAEAPVQAAAPAPVEEAAAQPAPKAKHAAKPAKKTVAKRSPKSVAAKSERKPAVASAKSDASKKESVWTKLLKR